MQRTIGVTLQNRILRLTAQRKANVKIEEYEKRYIEAHRSKGCVVLALHHRFSGLHYTILQTHGHSFIGVRHPLANAEGLEKATPAGVMRDAGEDGKLEEGKKSHVDEEEESESREETSFAVRGGEIEKEEGKGEIEDGEERWRRECDEEEKDDEQFVEKEYADVTDLVERKYERTTVFQKESSFSSFSSSSTTSSASFSLLFSIVTRMEKQKKHRMSPYRYDGSTNWISR